MKKSDLIRENNSLRLKIEILNKEISDYKKLLETTRDCYGLKLMELEQKRLLLEHPDVLVDDIEWIPANKIFDPPPTRYKFVYSIKGERQ